MPIHHGNLFRPESHQPMSPDFIKHHLHSGATLRRVHED
jgi:hypothetical protein